MKEALLKLSVKMQTLMMREEGQDLIEYALLASLIALAAVTTMRGLGTEINAAFTQIATTLQGA